MMKVSIVALVLTAAVGCLAFAAAQEAAPPLPQSLAALEQAIDAKDLASAYRQAHVIAQMFASRGKPAATAEELYASALADQYLAAEKLQAAMAKGLTPAQMRRAVATLAALSITAPPAGVADMRLVRTGGQELDIKEFLVPGKTTIVDLFSVYCGWCVKYAPKLEAMAKGRADVAVVQFDINRPEAKRIDAGSPFGKQYNVRGVPQLKAFGPDGQLVAEGRQVEKMFGVPIKP